MNKELNMPHNWQHPQPALAFERARNLEWAGVRLTNAPIQAGETGALIPEFCRIKTATAYTGLSRGKIYQGINEGWIRSVSLRKQGQKFSVNAEHAIKAFARLREVMEGLSTEKGIKEYLVLLSICQTCKYMGVDFLDFLRSGEKDIYAFAESRRSSKKASPTNPSPTLPADTPPDTANPNVPPGSGRQHSSM